MDLQEYLNNAMKAQRESQLRDSDQLSLGELILKIEPIVEKQAVRDSEAIVVYDFGYLFPNKIDSWRGAYSELALNFVQEGPAMKVSEFLAMCKEAVGKEFYGYKGGEFVMSKRTPVWVANYGESGNTAVIDVVDNGYQVILITAYREY